MREKKVLKDIVPRILIHGVGTVVIGALIVLTFFPFFAPFIALFVALVATVAIYEYGKFLSKKGLIFPSFPILLACFLYVFASLFDNYIPEIVLGGTLLWLFIYFAIKNREPLNNIATSFFGLIYIAIPFGLLVKITYHVPELEGSFWLAFLIIVTKGADLGGYFFGSLLGKWPLAKKLSPNKTVEGALGGIVTATFAAILLWFLEQRFFHLIDLSLVEVVFLGIALALFSEMGDLAESLLKRDAKVKDSNTLPGVGGVLDTVDSLLFTTPLLFIYLKFYYNV